MASLEQVPNCFNGEELAKLYQNARDENELLEFKNYELMFKIQELESNQRKILSKLSHVDGSSNKENWATPRVGAAAAATTTIAANQNAEPPTTNLKLLPVNSREAANHNGSGTLGAASALAAGEIIDDVGLADLNTNTNALAPSGAKVGPDGAVLAPSPTANDDVVTVASESRPLDRAGSPLGEPTEARAAATGCCEDGARSAHKEPLGSGGSLKEPNLAGQQDDDHLGHENMSNSSRKGELAARSKTNNDCMTGMRPKSHDIDSMLSFGRPDDSDGNVAALTELNLQQAGHQWQLDGERLIEYNGSGSDGSLIVMPLCRPSTELDAEARFSQVGGSLIDVSEQSTNGEAKVISIDHGHGDAETDGWPLSASLRIATPSSEQLDDEMTSNQENQQRTLSRPIANAKIAMPVSRRSLCAGVKALGPPAPKRAAKGSAPVKIQQDTKRTAVTTASATSSLKLRSKSNLDSSSVPRRTRSQQQQQPQQSSATNHRGSLDCKTLQIGSPSALRSQAINASSNSLTVAAAATAKFQRSRSYSSIGFVTQIPTLISQSHAAGKTPQKGAASSQTSASPFGADKKPLDERPTIDGKKGKSGSPMMNQASSKSMSNLSFAPAATALDEKTNCGCRDGGNDDDQVSAEPGKSSPSHLLSKSCSTLAHPKASEHDSPCRTGDNEIDSECSQCKLLQSKVSLLIKDRKLLAEQLNEMEELENDSRLMSQKLACKLSLMEEQIGLNKIELFKRSDNETKLMFQNKRLNFELKEKYEYIQQLQCQLSKLQAKLTLANEKMARFELDELAEKKRNNCSSAKLNSSSKEELGKQQSVSSDDDSAIDVFVKLNASQSASKSAASSAAADSPDGQSGLANCRDADAAAVVVDNLNSAGSIATNSSAEDSAYSAKTSSSASSSSYANSDDGSRSESEQQTNSLPSVTKEDSDEAAVAVESVGCNSSKRVDGSDLLECSNLAGKQVEQQPAVASVSSSSSGDESDHHESTISNSNGLPGAEANNSPQSGQFVSPASSSSAGLTNRQQVLRKKISTARILRGIQVQTTASQVINCSDQALDHQHRRQADSSSSSLSIIKSNTGCVAGHQARYAQVVTDDNKSNQLKTAEQVSFSDHSDRRKPINSNVEQQIESLLISEQQNKQQDIDLALKGVDDLENDCCQDEALKSLIDTSALAGSKIHSDADNQRNLSMDDKNSTIDQYKREIANLRLRLLQAHALNDNLTAELNIKQPVGHNHSSTIKALVGDGGTEQQRTSVIYVNGNMTPASYQPNNHRQHQQQQRLQTGSYICCDNNLDSNLDTNRAMMIDFLKFLLDKIHFHHGRTFELVNECQKLAMNALISSYSHQINLVHHNEVVLAGNQASLRYQQSQQLEQRFNQMAPVRPPPRRRCSIIKGSAVDSDGGGGGGGGGGNGRGKDSDESDNNCKHQPPTASKTGHISALQVAKQTLFSIVPIHGGGSSKSGCSKNSAKEKANAELSKQQDSRPIASGNNNQSATIDLSNSDWIVLNQSQQQQLMQEPAAMSARQQQNVSILKINPRQANGSSSQNCNQSFELNRVKNSLSEDIERFRVHFNGQLLDLLNRQNFCESIITEKLKSFRSINKIILNQDSSNKRPQSMLSSFANNASIATSDNRANQRKCNVYGNSDMAMAMPISIVEKNININYISSRQQNQSVQSNWINGFNEQNTKINGPNSLC